MNADYSILEDRKLEIQGLYESNLVRMFFFLVAAFIRVHQMLSAPH